MRSIDRTSCYILLGLLFLGGAALRLWGVTERGLHTHDEARYLIVADSYLEAASVVMGSAFGEEKINYNEFGDEMRRKGGSFFAHAKEGHIFLLAGWRLLAGRSDTGTILYSIFCSLISAWLIYRLARSFGMGRSPAAASSAALLFSPFFLYYSRSTLSEADSIAFLLASMVLSVQTWEYFKQANKKKFIIRIICAGVLAGVAFTCHYNKVWAIGLMGIILTVAAWKSNRGEGGITKILALPALFSIGFAIPILLLQAITLVIAIKVNGAYPGYMTYLGDLWYHFTTFHAHPDAARIGEGATRPADLFFGLKLLIKWRGWVFSVLLLITIIAAAIHARRDYRLRLLLLILLPAFAIFSLYRFQVERSFVGLEPFIAMLIGYVWWSAAVAIQKRDPKRQGDAPLLMTWAVSIFIVMLSLPYAIGIVRSDDSTFKQASHEFAPRLIAEGGHVTAGSVTWHVRPQWIFYLNQYVDLKENENAANAQINWSDDSVGDYILIEKFDYEDSPLFPLEIFKGRKPIIKIPPQKFSPAIEIFNMKATTSR